MRRRIPCTKRLVAVVLLLSMIISLTGCKSSDYDQAVGLYIAGNYESALRLFKSLGEYEDSALWAQKCQYQKAVALWDEKQYDEACTLFVELGDYEDSASYLDRKGRRKFFDYVQQNESIVKEAENYTYTISVQYENPNPDEDTPVEHLQILKEYKTDGLGVMFYLSITENGIVVIGGKSLILVSNARLEDAGYGVMNMGDYRADDEITWSISYDVSGTKIDGTSVDADATSLMSNPTDWVSDTVAVLQACLRESALGLTMEDIGFLSYSK